MLYDKDGKCGAWASFWIDLLHTHGVANVELVNVERILTNGISPLPSNASALVANAVTAFNALPNPDIPSGYDLINQSIIMVRNWNIETNKFYKEVMHTLKITGLISITENNAAQEGIQAQGVNDDSESDIDDPISMFTDHALVRIQFVEVVVALKLLSTSITTPHMEQVHLQLPMTQMPLLIGRIAVLPVLPHLSTTIPL
ncbi:MAG: hypothetical protein IPL33_16740 [Sphingobacteriales bacterium]|nr:hypothetical protein [Sphingobacteriales bacterium]